MPQKAEAALLALGPGGLPRPMLVAARVLGTNPRRPISKAGCVSAACGSCGVSRSVHEIGDRQRRDNLNSHSRNDRSVHPERHELAGLMDRVVF